MSTSRTATPRRSHHTATRAVGAAAVLVSAAMLAGPDPALADGPTNQQGAYVDQQGAYVGSMLTMHDASTPYTEMDDYVRALVFWHQNPDWNPAN